MLRLIRLFTLLLCLVLIVTGCQWVVVPVVLPTTGSTTASTTASDPVPALVSAVQPAQALDASFLFDLQIDLEAPRDIGSLPALGIRHLSYFKGGRIVGPAIQGEVLPGGENWFLIRDNCVCDLFIQGQLRTTDGALITFAGHGYSRTTPAIRQAIFDGAEINPADYAFRGVPFFETDDPHYDWLNHVVTVATYRLEAEQVIFRVYAIR